MELFGDEFGICPHCGYVVGTHAEEAIHIEPGTLLYDRYIVGKVLGYGGFGVTYLGWDGKLEQKVAIKEYLPGEFSTRMPGQSHVTVFNGEKNEQFHDGLRKFVEEAKHLAKFQNEQGIVKIFDSFEENHTAYIVMEYLDGETLTEYLRREKTIPEDVAVTMLMPVMESLQAVHDEGLLHRDIAPDNIFLTKSGEVKLIDFGASRYATTSHSRSLTVIIKPGYSPEEQYRSRGDQGPHTDVYAIAATLYKMMTGKTPPDAMERRAKYENQNKDILEEPHKINKKISPNRENAILNAMNVRIEDRTPDIATFIKDLNADPPVKRVYGKIKKIDLYSWPLWLKILVPSLLSLILIFATLLLTGVIKFSNFTEEIVIPENIVVVPDVEGLYKDEALKMIETGQLLASTDGAIESNYIPAGKIILQTPVGGSYMDINDTVLLMISSGKGVESPVGGVSTVPYVIWEAKDTAISKLIQAGLAEPEIIEKNDENVAYGSVISQSIEAGTQVDEGTRITLTISIGPATFDMPNVIGQAKEKAESTLTGKGLVVIVEYQKNDSVAEGNVISQSVSAGSSVKRGDEVTITISSGRNTVDVANVVGKFQSDAVSALEKQGFKVKVLENYDSSVASGKVISQNPQAGTSQIPGTTIVIYVSKGKQQIAVPSVVGQTRSSASSTLTQCGFNVSVVEQYSSTVSSGNIISQAPAAGTSQVVGTTVTIYVSKGVEQYIDSISLSINGTTVGTEITMNVGERIGFGYRMTGPSGTDWDKKTVVLESDNSSVVSVADNYVTALKPGVANITATAYYDSRYQTKISCKITVVRPTTYVPDVTGKTQTEATSDLEEWGLKVAVMEEYSETVSKGRVIRQSPGAESSNVYEGDTVTIVVSKGPQNDVYRVSVSSYPSSLEVNQTSRVFLSESSYSGTDYGATWSSSNTNVITVSGNGQYADVTAKSAGTATITFISTNNPQCSGSFKVTVNEQQGQIITISNVYLSKKSDIVYLCGTVTSTTSMSDAWCFGSVNGIMQEGSVNGGSFSLPLATPTQMSQLGFTEGGSYTCTITVTDRTTGVKGYATVNVTY